MSGSSAERAEIGRRARRRGRRAELLCRIALLLKGYVILDHGRAGRRGSGAGEVDIIAKRGATLAFIEVKARVSADDAAWALRPAQRRRLERAAGAFLLHHPDYAGSDLRFDVMLVGGWRWPRHLIDAWREGG